MSTIDFVVDLGLLGERTVCVEYTYSRGRPGRMYMPNGDPGYPDEPPECDIDKVTLEGHDVTWLLSEKLQDHDPLFDAIGEEEYINDTADTDQLVRDLNHEI